MSEARYLGGDCVLYGNFRSHFGTQFLGACDDKLPVVVVAPSYEEWRIEDEGLVKRAALGDPRKVSEMLNAEIKDKASKQPAFREGWYR